MIAQRCRSWHASEAVNTKRGGGTYVVSVAGCTCRGFRYRGTCKHYRSFIDRMCLWKGRGQTAEQAVNMTCPDCGGKTENYLVS